MGKVEGWEWDGIKREGLPTARKSTSGVRKKVKVPKPRSDDESGDDEGNERREIEVKVNNGGMEHEKESTAIKEGDDKMEEEPRKIRIVDINSLLEPESPSPPPSPPLPVKKKINPSSRKPKEVVNGPGIIQLVDIFAAPERRSKSKSPSPPPSPPPSPLQVRRNKDQYNPFLPPCKFHATMVMPTKAPLAEQYVPPPPPKKKKEETSPNILLPVSLSPVAMSFSLPTGGYPKPKPRPKSPNLREKLPPHPSFPFRGLLSSPPPLTPPKVRTRPPSPPPPPVRARPPPPVKAKARPLPPPKPIPPVKAKVRPQLPTAKANRRQPPQPVRPQPPPMPAHLLPPLQPKMQSPWLYNTNMTPPNPWVQWPEMPFSSANTVKLGCGTVIPAARLTGMSGVTIGPTGLPENINRIIYVKNLSHNCDERCLYLLFFSCGTIRNVYGGPFRNYSAHALVTFAHFDMANIALHQGKFMRHCNQHLSVSPYQPEGVSIVGTAIPQLPSLEIARSVPVPRPAPPPRPPYKPESAEVPKSIRLECGTTVPAEKLKGFSEEIIRCIRDPYRVEKQIYIQNLSSTCTAKCAFALFSHCGKIRNIQVGPAGSGYGINSTHAVVVFNTAEMAREALTYGQKLKHSNWYLSVSPHDPKRDPGVRTAIPQLPPVGSSSSLAIGMQAWSNAAGVDDQGDDDDVVEIEFVKKTPEIIDIS